MPTYEYRCKSCDHEMEVQQAFSDDPLDTCPECQGPLKKVYGNVGIAFKGSGFYKNDARKSSTTSGSSGASSSAKSDSGSSSTGTSDSSSTSKEKTSTEKTSTSTPTKSD